MRADRLWVIQLNKASKWGEYEILEARPSVAAMMWNAALNLYYANTVEPFIDEELKGDTPPEREAKMDNDRRRVTCYHCKRTAVFTEEVVTSIAKRYTVRRCLVCGRSSRERGANQADAEPPERPD